jgi:hypothetical protein
VSAESVTGQRICHAGRTGLHTKMPAQDASTPINPK